MSQATAEKIKKIVVEKFKLDPEKDKAKLKDSASFTDDIGADSLDQAELIMLLEEEFGCEIQQQDAEKIKTIKDAVDFVEKNLSK